MTVHYQFYFNFPQIIRPIFYLLFAYRLLEFCLNTLGKRGKTYFIFMTAFTLAVFSHNITFILGMYGYVSL